MAQYLLTNLFSFIVKKTAVVIQVSSYSCVCAEAIVGSFSSFEGCFKENVTSKLNLAVDLVFCDYSMLVMLYKWTMCPFTWLVFE